jgi:hypothetical protein
MNKELVKKLARFQYQLRYNESLDDRGETTQRLYEKVAECHLKFLELEGLYLKESK